MTDELPPGPFSKGEKVPHDGQFVCVPCGYKHQYKTGEEFGECISCLSGTKDGQHEEYLEGVEMWEPVTTPKEETKTV